MSYKLAVLATPGLVAYWRLGGADAATVGLDTSAARRHGVSASASAYAQAGAVAGDADGAPVFTGAHRISMGHDAAFNPARFSVECFALPTELDGLYHTPVMSRDSALGRGWNLYLGDNGRWQGWIGLGGAGAWLIVDSGVAAVAQQWAHLVLTYDGRRLSLFVDGELQKTVAGTLAVNQTQPLTVGQTYEASLGWEGKVDEVSVYDRALTEDEVRGHWRESRAVNIGATYEDPEDPPEWTPVGPITIDTEVYVAGIDGDLREDISDDFVAGYVDWHEEREGGSLWGGELTLRDPGKVRVLSDFLRLWVTVTYGDGRRRRKPLGQFVVSPARERHSDWDGWGTFTLQDMTVLLDQAAFSANVAYPAGGNFADRIEDLIDLAGPGLRRDVRATSQALGYGRTWYRGRTVRYATERLRQAIGYLPVHMEMDGTLTTLPVRDFRDVAPAVTFRGNDYLTDPGIELEPSGDPLANVVQVISADPAKDTIFWEERNTDGDSETAIQNIDPPREIVRVIKDAEIETLAAAKARARVELNRLGSYYRTLRLSTLPNLDPGIYRTADVRFRTEKLRPQGRYYIRGWRIGLTHNDAATQWELGRLFTYPEDA